MVDSLIPRNSCGECSKRTKDGVPVVLIEVVGEVVHKLHSCWPPELGVELLAGSDEITGGMHLVSTFNLMRV